MRKQTLMSSKQQGFTLLEALVALIIFSVIVVGSGVVLNWILKTQTNAYINGIIIDQMQARLQGAIVSPLSASNPCNSIDKTPFSVDGQTYHISCDIQPIAVNSTTINWPILAVSTTQDSADACASAVVTNTPPDLTCYIVGQ